MGAAASIDTKISYSYQDLQDQNFIKLIPNCHEKTLAIYACNFPEILNERVLEFINSFVNEGENYSIVYFHGGIKVKPGFNWIREAYRKVDYSKRKMLQALYRLWAYDSVEKYIKENMQSVYTPYLGTTLTGITVFILLTILVSQTHSLLSLLEYGYFHNKVNIYETDYSKDTILNLPQNGTFKNYCFNENVENMPFTEESVLDHELGHQIGINIKNIGTLMGSGNICQCAESCYIEYKKGSIISRGCDAGSDKPEILPKLYSNFFFIRSYKVMRKVIPCGQNLGLENYQNEKRLDFGIMSQSYSFLVHDLCQKLAVGISLLLILAGVTLPLLLCAETENKSGVGRKISAYNMHRAKQSDQAEAENLAKEVLRKKGPGGNTSVTNRYTGTSMRANNGRESNKSFKSIRSTNSDRVDGKGYIPKKRDSVADAKSILRQIKENRVERHVQRTNTYDDAVSKKKFLKK